MIFRAPQSPHRYSTPRISGIGTVDEASTAVVEAPGTPALFILMSGRLEIE